MGYLRSHQAVKNLEILCILLLLLETMLGWNLHELTAKKENQFLFLEIDNLSIIYAEDTSVILGILHQSSFQSIVKFAAVNM